MLKALLKKIVLFILLIALADFLFGKCMDYINAHTYKGDYGRNNYICNEADQDILIFGSSRAIHHYDPDVFEDILGMSCYNCGEDGMGIILAYGRYKLAQRKHQPKLIIYDIEVAFDLMRNDNSKFLGFLRPYYNVAGIDSIFWGIDSNEKFKMKSQAYRYNSRWLEIVAQYISRSNDFACDYKYSPLQKMMDYEPDSYVFVSDDDCDDLKLEFLEEFLLDCNKNKTRVIFTISPVYGEVSNHLLKPFKELVLKYNLELLDHFADERFINNKNLFADKMHLNKGGTAFFSEIVAREIESLIK